MDNKVFFEACAEEYDNTYYKSENKENMIINECLSGVIQKNNIASAIEFGCGSGYWLLSLATQKVKRIVGIDLAVEMLSVAQKRLKKYPFVSLLQADITLPMEFKEPFDLAILSFVLSIVDRDKSESVLCNMSKSIKHNGLLFLVENKQPLETGNDIYPLTLSERWGTNIFNITYSLYNPSFLISRLETHGFTTLHLIDVNSDIYILIAKRK